MALTGYNDDFSDSRTADAWNEIASMCRKTYTTAIIGTGARADGNTFNQARIFGDDGELIGFHDMLMPSEQDREWVTPGEELRDFEAGDLSFGCLIGNDFWVAPGTGPYPDRRLSYQLGRNHGAQIIFHLNHSGIDAQYREYYDCNLRLRAKEARSAVVTVNAADPKGPLNVPSGLISAEGLWVEKVALTGEHTFTMDIEVD